jgi:hypothetical protein
MRSHDHLRKFPESALTALKAANEIDPFLHRLEGILRAGGQTHQLAYAPTPAVRRGRR